MEIYTRYKQGESIRKITRDLHISRNTVRKYVRSDEEYPQYHHVNPRPSLLDPFKDYLIDRINAARPEWIPATVLLKELRSKGYTGQISILRQYISQFKHKTKDEPVIRFETSKGEQVQIDFITISFNKKHYKAFVATLGYSRYCYIEFFANEKAQSWMMGLTHAFEFFGGVTEEVLCDNAKALVVKRDAYGAGQHKFNDEFLDLSKRYHFKIRACQPYRAKTKGKVERFNGYVKHSFIIPLLSSYRQHKLEISIDILNYKVKEWLNTEGNRRVHASLHKRPCDLFAQEKKSLLPLPTFVVPYNEQAQSQHTDTVLVHHPHTPMQQIQPSATVFDALLNF